MPFACNSALIRSAISGFGEVFKGVFRASGKEVALKIMDIESDVDVKRVEEQVKLIKACDSPHIVKYYGSYFKKDKLWVRGLPVKFPHPGCSLPSNFVMPAHVWT